ncbi:high affinity immunoglobulin gamma Fc receptor I-like isoform X2 [Genypterus blacodes]|uniref:high affinity immunoglobulin gamma Fc receptor I-like isoform X2 n=1 Tax=Genypterus blacodes TaxID=154954 RepID=UPI003F77605D
MDAVVSLLVALTLPQFIVSSTVYVASIQAVLTQIEGEPRIFSGEGARLRCNIPDDKKSTWQYQWFREGELLSQNGEDFILWNAEPKHGGKFYCQGFRETAVGITRTRPSLLLEINVDGGWAILQFTSSSSIVGEDVTMTCRTRSSPQLKEVILYKDGVETIRQHSPQFILSRVRVEDQGLYSCRSTWDIQMRSHSAHSVAVQLYISELLTQPILEIISYNVPVTMLRLVCHVQYSARPPAPPINFYFYKNGKSLATATSENTLLAKKSAGLYHCKARVPVFNVVKMSEPKNYGQAPGSKQRSAEGGADPHATLPPAVETVPASPSPQQSHSSVPPPHPLTTVEHFTPRSTQTETLPPDDDDDDDTKQTVTAEPFEMSGGSASSADWQDAMTS